MTNEERQKLDDIHSALFKKPAGAGPNDRALIEDIRVVVQAYKRASWVTRVTVWILPTIAAIGASFQWAYHTVTGLIK